MSRVYHWCIPLIALAGLTFLSGLIPELIVIVKPTLLLLFGWVFFLIEKLPSVTIDRWSIAGGIIALVFIALLTHRFLAWWWRSTHHEGLRAWAWRWSAAIVIAVVLQFVICIAFTGVVHQTTWLIRSPEPFATAWGPEPPLLFKVRSTVLYQIEQDDAASADELRARLYNDPQMIALLDDYHIQVGSKDGRTFVLFFPRQLDRLGKDLGAVVIESDGHWNTLNRDELEEWLRIVMRRGADIPT